MFDNSVSAQEPKAYAGMRIQTSNYGRPIPIVWGMNRISGNIIWYGDFQIGRAHV